jgi:hypothetical protein
MSVPKAELKRWSVKGPSLRELFVGELRDLHDVENRLIKALPKPAKRANSGELRSGLKLIWHKPTSLANASSKLWCHWAKKPSRKQCSARITQEGNELMGEEVEWNCYGRRLACRRAKGRALRNCDLWLRSKLGQRTAQDDDAELLAKTLK